MNYYYPYYNLYPMMSAPAKTGLLSSLFGGRFSLSSIMNGTQKTLNFVNQAIPVIKQVSPVMKNAKTMFKVMSEFKKTDTPKKKTNNNYKVVQNNNNISNNVNYDIMEEEKDNGPTFFL